MKLYPYVAIAFLTVLGINNGRILAQPCLNCWINPKTGQMESLDRIVPRQTPTPPAVTSPPPPLPPLDAESPLPTETGKNPDNPPKPDETAQKKPKPPLIEGDPLDQAEKEPQPLPRTQVEPRLRNEQQQQRENQQNPFNSI